MLPDDLVTVLVCAQSKQPLIYFPKGEADRDEADAFLVCATSGLRYRLDQGVPVMLVEEAQLLPPNEIGRLVSRARELGLRVPT